MANCEDASDAQSLSRAGIHEPAASCSCQVTLRSEKRPENRALMSTSKTLKIRGTSPPRISEKSSGKCLLARETASMEGQGIMFWFCIWKRAVVLNCYLVSSSLGKCVKMQTYRFPDQSLVVLSP